MKEKILVYAKDKFFKEGFYKTTMDEIASELKISKKTIYKHYPSKEALVTEIFESMFIKINSAHDEILQKEINSLEKLIEIGKFITRNTLQISNELLNDLRVHMPHLWTIMDDFRKKRLLKNFTIILDQGKKEGLIKDIPTQILTTIFISSIRSVINPDFILNNNFSMQEAGKLALVFLISGMLTSKGQEIFNKITLEL